MAAKRKPAKLTAAATRGDIDAAFDVCEMGLKHLAARIERLEQADAGAQSQACSAQVRAEIERAFATVDGAIGVLNGRVEAVDRRIDALRSLNFDAQIQRYAVRRDVREALAVTRAGFLGRLRWLLTGRTA